MLTKSTWHYSQNGWYDIILKYRRVRGVFEFSGQVGSNTQIYRGPVALTGKSDQ